MVNFDQGLYLRTLIPGGFLVCYPVTIINMNIQKYKDITIVFQSKISLAEELKNIKHI